MEFTEWEPIYETILDDFGYDRRADERARETLASMTSPIPSDRFEAVDGATVAVVGAGPSLENPRALEPAREADVVFAASTAADVCLERGVSVDCMVTDLDKNPETARRLTYEGVPVAIHAHGDNVAQLEAVVPACDRSFVVPTTQARPQRPVINPGGFTDGDRAAFLADHFGAERLRFAGWDFDDDTVDPEKARKLEWAGRLLYWLERRRGEQFCVLDGQREDICLPSGDGDNN